MKGSLGLVEIGFMLYLIRICEVLNPAIQLTMSGFEHKLDFELPAGQYK